MYDLACFLRFIQYITSLRSLIYKILVDAPIFLNRILNINYTQKGI